jgi:hypothetical protein
MKLREEIQEKIRMLAYEVATGDTLAWLTWEVTGNPSLYPLVAKLNKIENPNLIVAGQMLYIPTAYTQPLPICWYHPRYPMDNWRISGYNFGDLYPEGMPYAGTPHTGTDFASDDDRVYPFAPGVVIYINYDEHGYGNYLRMEHFDSNEMWSYSLYAHLAAYSDAVHYGSRVYHYNSVGVMGETGNAFGAHLHFERPTTLRFPGQKNMTPSNLRDWYRDPMVDIGKSPLEYYAPGVESVRYPTIEELQIILTYGDTE